MSDPSIEFTISRQTLYEGKIVHLRKDRVRLPNGKETDREVVLHPGAVAVLAIIEDDVLLVSQYRYPVQARLWEIPAGKLEPGEDPKSAAVRELAEETGYKAGKVKKLFTFFTTPGFSNEVLHLFLATDLVAGEAHPDDDEFVDCERVSKEEISTLIATGDIVDAKTLLALVAFLGDQLPKG
ncbi:MAG: NUDIX hydrolase [Firmicutes bacterium]|nr:NUDIX hydrolase [Bacillota bacterium]